MEASDKRTVNEAPKFSQSDSRLDIQHKPGISYKAPAWSSAPSEMVKDYQLEILKCGMSIKTLNLSEFCRMNGKGWLCFGRVPENDSIVQHPSTSRFHCVIQFKNDGTVYLYDLGSTHGTFLNKVKIAPWQYVRVMVGDQIRIAESERIYVLQGPEEEHEGREKENPRSVTQSAPKSHDMDFLKKRKSNEDVLDASLVQQIEAAILSGQFDWRMYAEQYSLGQKQQQLKDKIMKKEKRIESLQSENEKILAKQRSEGDGFAADVLTDGQKNTLAKNESTISILSEELEDLEDQIIESISASLGSKSGSKRQKPGHESNDSDEDDELYDRTGLESASNRRRRRQKGVSKPLGAKDLVAQIRDLEKEREYIDNEIQNLASLPEEPNASVDVSINGKDDLLDTFLSSMKTADDKTRMKNLRNRQSHVRIALEKARSLLKVADPMGYYSTQARSENV
jgi:pSer/pThr/pTyr-binding forkhead associated (FHA) protein